MNCIYIKSAVSVINNKRKGAYTRGPIFGWKNALLIWGAYIQGSLYTRGGGRGGGIYGILRYIELIFSNTLCLFNAVLPAPQF